MMQGIRVVPQLAATNTRHTVVVCSLLLLCCVLSSHPQARIVALNAQYFLKTGGNFVISIKASCIDSTAQPEAVFAREVKKLIESQLKPKEQVGLADRG